jgi:hypothetical protein
MSIYAYVDIYVSIQLTVYSSVCCHICQYAYSSQDIQICSRIYKYMSIYAYIDIYLSIQPLTAYCSVAIYANRLIIHKLFKFVDVSTNIYGNILIVHKLFKFVHVSTNICLYTNILTYIYQYGL